MQYEASSTTYQIQLSLLLSFSSRTLSKPRPAPIRQSAPLELFKRKLTQCARLVSPAESHHLILKIKYKSLLLVRSCHPPPPHPVPRIPLGLHLHTQNSRAGFPASLWPLKSSSGRTPCHWGRTCYHHTRCGLFLAVFIRFISRLVIADFENSH